DFSALSQTINVWVKGIFTSITNAIGNVDWDLIGEKIGTFLADIDVADMAFSLAESLWKALNAEIKAYSKMFSAAPIETALISLLAIPKVLKSIAGLKYFKQIESLFGILGDSVKVVADTFISFNSTTCSIKKATLEVIESGVKKLTKSLTKMQKGIIGVTAVFGEFSLAKDAFYDIASGGDNLVESLGKIAIGAGAAAAALKLMGLSNPFTA